jgi:hypothetical protein
MGSKGGGNSSSGNSFGFSSGTSTYTPNPQSMAAYQQALGLAQNAVSRPYEPYQGEMAAGFTPDQMSAMQGIRNTQNIAQPYINTAKNLIGQGVDYSNPANFNQYSLNQYMNPYQQSVVDATMNQLAQTQAQAEQGAQSRSALQGTFGGSGQYLGRAEVARQQGLANAQTLAQLNASNYQQAQNQYNQQQQQAIQTAQQAAYGLGQLGNMAQSSALTGINALLQSGGMQQQLAQQQLTGAYNQWLQSKAYPYQQAAFQAGIAGGIGPNMGGTTTYSGINMGQQQQQQSGGGGGASGALQMLGSLVPAMFPSDERLKTDKQKIGKDERTGLDMYAYRYKGDPKSYPKVVGPMAQDVEEKYPGFVFDVGGRKAVADLGRFMPRDEKASGGSSSSDGAAAAPSSATKATDPSAYYTPYGMSGPVQGSMQAAQNAQMDPGTAQFIKGAFDPKTADEMARAKWVSPTMETRTAPEDSFGYFSELARALESEEEAPRQTRARGGGFGELPAQVNPNPLSGSPPIGVNFLDPKPSPDSLPAMNKDTKLMFGANPIDSPQGFATIAAIPSAGMASSNLAQDAAKWAKGVVPPPAENIGKSKTADGIAKAKAEANAAVDAAKPGKGGGGGGEGLGKLAKGAKSAIDKISGGKESALPVETTPDTPQDTPASEAGKGFEGGVDTAPAVPETPPMADTGMGGMDTMADISGGADRLKGLGGFGGLFAAYGGRIQKDIGGAAGGFGGPGASGDIAPSGLAEAGGIGAPSLLGTSGAGLGELTLGFGNKPSELAGFGDIKGETRTGNDLVKGWMDEYRADYKGGPQRTPKEQGMPDMPDAEYYKTPLNISEISIGSNGTPNPGGITSYTPIATGMKANGGIGLFPTFSPPTNGSDYNNTDKMFQAPKTNGKVQGYYTGLDSQQVNPDTGLFNIAYLGPYYGGFFNKGGRVSKAGGGNFDLGFNDEAPEINTPEIETAWDGGRIGMAAGGTRGGTLNIDQAVRLLMQNGATPTEAAYLAAIMMPESKGQTGIHSAPELKRDNSYGLWQINMLGGMGPERMRRYGLKSYNDLYDPNVNARAAIDLARNGRGLKNWSTYIHGNYRPYLNQARYYANKYAGDPEAVKAPVEFTPARPSGFEPRAFAQASAPARRPMGIIPRIIQEVVGVPSAHAEPAVGSNLNRINRADPSGPLLPSAAPIARGAAQRYIGNRAANRDVPTLLDPEPQYANAYGTSTMDEQGKLSRRVPAYLTNNEGTDVPRAMTYTGNRAPGFQDLTMNPFYQDEPVAAQDEPAQQPAKPTQAAAKQAQQEENPIEGLFNALGSGINELGTGIGQGLDQIGTGIGQGIEELGTGINSIFGEDNPQETTKKATKSATPNQSAQSDEAEGELDFGKMLGFKHGGKVKKSRKKMGR